MENVDCGRDVSHDPHNVRSPLAPRGQHTSNLSDGSRLAPNQHVAKAKGSLCDVVGFRQ